MRSVAIIGAGLGGVSALLQMLDDNHKINYVIYEPSTPVYNSSLSSYSIEHLCNTSVLVNSLYENKPEDFLVYLQTQGYPVHGDDFFPRFLLLQYAREKLNNAMKLAHKRNSTITIVKRKIEKFCVNIDKKVVLFDVDGNKFYHDNVFVSPGPSLKGISNEEKKDDVKGMFTDSKIENLSEFSIKKNRVAIMGSKLSAIDSAIFLCKKGIKVTIYSPSGELPSVRTALVYNNDINQNLSEELSPFTKKSFLKTINKYVCRERNVVGYIHKNAHQQLLMDIDASLTGNSHWQKAIANIIDYANDRLLEIPENQKISIMNRTRPLVSRYISSFPLENAIKINELINNSMLDVKKGAVQDFSFLDGILFNAKDGKSYDGIVMATGVNNLNILRVGNEYILSYESNKGVGISKEDYFSLKSIGVWISGSPLHSIYPIVNYLKFCVNQAHKFSKYIKEN